MADTIFHKIIRREIPAEIISEDEHCIVIRDIQPVSPVHLLVVAKKTLPSMADCSAADQPLLGHMLLVATKAAEQEGLSSQGFRIVINSGEDAGQSVPQLHIHVLGGRVFGWPPG